MRAARGAVVFLGLGSNIGDRAAALRRAVARVAHALEIDACSPVYESEPFGYTDQPRFLNMAIRGHSTLDPRELLTAVKQIERELGRIGTIRMGPRIIDIDVLLYGGLSLEEDDLVIPHPGMRDRAFVLQPLIDIDAELRHPVTGDLLRDRLAELGAAATTIVHIGDLDGIDSPAAGSDNAAL